MGRGEQRMRRGLALAAIAVAAPAAQASAQAPSCSTPTSPCARRRQGLSQPVSMAFLDSDEFLVLKKATGQVKWFRDGKLKATVLDLAVNSASERGLLGIALHPKFRKNGWVYLFWSESRSGLDSITLDDARLMGNRIDRFEWSFVRVRPQHHQVPLLPGRRRPAAARQSQRRRAALRARRQALHLRRRRGAPRPDAEPRTAVPPPAGDDQFGGPEPDDPHLTGVILRLHDDGAAPRDNPFFAAGAGWAARSARTSTSCSPTASATASASTSTRSPATCGWRRTATTRSPS